MRREQYAGYALIGIIASPTPYPSKEAMVKAAWEYADLMMLQHERRRMVPAENLGNEMGVGDLATRLQAEDPGTQFVIDHAAEYAVHLSQAGITLDGLRRGDFLAEATDGPSERPA